jgi:hypothetical protein
MKRERRCKKCQGGIRQWQENEEFEERKINGGKRSRKIGQNKENGLSFYIISVFVLFKKHHFTKMIFYLVTFV